MDRLGKAEELALKANLGEGEVVLGQAVGASRQAAVVTDRKVLIIKTGFMAGATFGSKVSSFDLRNISAVEIRTSVLVGVFEVAAGGVQNRQATTLGRSPNDDAYKVPNCVPFGKSDLPRFQALATLIRERTAAIGQPATTTPAAAQVAAARDTPDIPDQIRKLAELRDAGILTPVEFDAKKAELLARM